MSFFLPTLPYAYDAFEPHFDKTTMEIHHSKHHQGYVNNLNKAIENSPEKDASLESLVARAGALGNTIRNNAGGHWNHSFFWESLQKDAKPLNNQVLTVAIKSAFGSFEQLKEVFFQAALSRFGSGWAWLIVDNNGKLAITSTPNQDNPLMDIAPEKGHPLLGIDIWEHAYYLKYQNRRAEYVQAFWNLVNWEVVRKRFEATNK